MSNLPRVNEPGLVFHATANAVHGLPLYRDEVDRTRQCELLAEEIEASGWIVLMWCLMTTHIHLVAQLQKPTLSSGFRRLQSRYARFYNWRHGRRGAMWQRRVHTEVIQSEHHLFESLRYVALNPVRANMVDAPEDWDWCSYGSAIGVRWPDPLVDEHALLHLFGRDRAVARRRLRAFVEEKNPRERWRQTRLRAGSDAKK